MPVPKLVLFDLENGWFVMEDLGEQSLQDVAIRHPHPRGIYERVIEILFRMQHVGVEGFDTAWCCQTKGYDQSVMRRFESNYFRDAFLCKYLGLKGDWPELEGPFAHLARMASKAM